MKIFENKKGEEGASSISWGTIVIWTIIIGVVIAVIVWMAIYSNIGKSAFEKITSARFV